MKQNKNGFSRGNIVYLIANIVFMILNIAYFDSKYELGVTNLSEHIGKIEIVGAVFILLSYCLFKIIEVIVNKFRNKDR